MRKLTIILMLLAMTFMSHAEVKDTLKRQKLKVDTEFQIVDTLTDAFLDTVVIRKKLQLNDYSMIGVQYGVGLSQMMWNPSQDQDWVFQPVNFGITYTRYGKMFGYMPYFGFQAGLFYGQEGFQFEYNEDKGYINKVEGAEKAIFKVVEMPILSHLHFDFWHTKIIAQIGLYLGYRLSVQRFPGETGYVSPEIERSFLPTDNRFDYGIKGGLGFGLVFDPIEIHFQAMYKHSMSSLYQPDYYSKYYYRYAYPMNIIISAGVHFQLTKRTGPTKKQLKQQAREIVYENLYTDSQGR